MPGYKSWLQTAGYFDGDGTIYFGDTSNQPYKLRISLVFIDRSIDQTREVKDFLNRHGIRTSNILKRSDSNAYEPAVSEFISARRTLKRMVRFLCKKEIGGRAALDYYEGLQETPWRQFSRLKLKLGEESGEIGRFLWTSHSPLQKVTKS